MFFKSFILNNSDGECVKYIKSALRQLYRKNFNKTAMELNNLIQHFPHAIHQLNYKERNDIMFMIRILSKSNLRLYSRSYTVLSYLCSVFGMKNEAFTFQKLMKTEGKSPSSESVISLMSPENYSKRLKWVKANDIPIDVSSALNIFSQKYGWQWALSLALYAESMYCPNLSESYSSSLICGHLVASGDWIKAIQNLNVSIAQGNLFTSTVIESMLEKSVQTSEWNSALNFILHSHKLGLVHSNTKIYETLIEKIPNWHGAFNVLSAVRSHCIPLDKRLLGLAMLKCESENKWEAASVLIKTLMMDESCHIDESLFNSWVSTFRKEQFIIQRNKELSWTDAVDEASKTLGYLLLIKACEENNNWHSALTAYSKISDRFNTAKITKYHESIISILSNNHLWNQSLKFLTSVTTQYNDKDKYKLYSFMLSKHCSVNMWRSSIKLLIAMIALEPSVIIPNNHYKEVLMQLARTGNTYQHSQLINYMQQHKLIESRIEEIPSSCLNKTPLNLSADLNDQINGYKHEVQSIKPTLIPDNI